jgi:DUF4097 and DUF4098 domain-containing protein YvlB
MKSPCVPAIGFALCVLLSTASPGAAETERVSRTVRLEPGGTLSLKSFSGRVTITGSDRTDVSIEATRYGTRDELDRDRLEIEGDGRRVRIEANRTDSRRERDRNHPVETDFDIKVPRLANLDIDVFSARLEVQAVEGDVRAKTFSGSIDVRTTAWRDRETIDLETFSGRVQLRLPESAQAAVDFESFSGRLDSYMPIVVQSSSRRKLNGRLGGSASGGGQLRVKTFSGSVTLDR